MKAVYSLLAECQRRDIHLQVVDGRLRFDAPDGALGDALVAQLREHKGDLLEVLIAASADAEAPWEATAAREAGIVPPGWTQPCCCARCGPVLLPSGFPAHVLGCQWCFNRIAGRPIPRPVARQDEARPA